MSSVKRRKVGGDVSPTIHRETISGVSSAISSIPDPDVLSGGAENKTAEDVEVAKTFKDLVYILIPLDYNLLTNQLVGNH